MWNDEPPCDECSKPKALYRENLLPWNIWGTCHKYGRQSGFSGIPPLDIRAVFATCEKYDATEEDYEKVLLIEDIMLPRLRKKYEQEAKAQRESEKGNKKWQG